jgi:hypothetical protein
LETLENWPGERGIEKTGGREQDVSADLDGRRNSRRKVLVHGLKSGHRRQSVGSKVSASLKEKGKMKKQTEKGIR